MPGIEMSRSRHRVSPRVSEARNASADEKARAQKPNCRIKSGNDSRTDSSSSTTDTSERSHVMTVPHYKRRSVMVFGPQGMENEKVAPGPSFVSAQRRPPCLTTMERLTGTPPPQA